MSEQNARAMALTALMQIEAGQRSGPVLAQLLATAELDKRDRAFVTNLVQGVTRMRRACDHLIDAHLDRKPDEVVRQVLRLGTYQLLWLQTPPHAAVDATVEIAPRRARGFVNAVLRRVADAGVTKSWPSAAVELSYPDWIVDRLTNDLGADADGALRAMNDPETPAPRPDGFVQGLASRWVVDEVAAQTGDLVADLCAAPGGKSTGLALGGATVIAAEIASHRIDVLAETAHRFGQGRVLVVRADAGSAPFPAASFDRVVVDAPCSGLGALGRRSDARWKIKARDVDRLARVQSRLLGSAAELVKPGGTLIYAVCTMTRAETSDVVGAFADERFEPDPLVWPDRWRPLEGTHHGGLLLPQDHGTDAMAVARWRRA
ncbi:MAG: hypothetical protein KDB16_14435 [Acidimicrobiales bacterium]|nr:hypothetical protein [Acidimicrobiales bacterium]